MLRGVPVPGSVPEERGHPQAARVREYALLQGQGTGKLQQVRSEQGGSRPGLGDPCGHPECGPRGESGPTERFKDLPESSVQEPQ